MPLTVPPTPLACSLRANNIGDKGASAIAAVLKETIISELLCAAAPKCLGFVSAPMTLPITSLSRARSLGGNGLGPDGGAALADGLKGNSTLRRLGYACGSNRLLSVRLSVSAH